jgi:hypothetical protein
MNTSTTIPTRDNPTEQAVSDRFLTAVVTRDYSTLNATLSPDVRLRALVPPGPFELTGAAAVTAQFEQWFAGGRRFRVIGHSATDIGLRVHAQWTIQRTPDSPTADPLLAEQHAFLTVGEAVEKIDLVCSGWQEVQR